MASFLQQMRELEELKKTAEANKIKLSTNKGVSSGTPSSMPKVGQVESLPKITVSQRAGLAAEKSSRVFAQNSPDMYNSTPKQIGPAQWSGPANISALRAAPGSSNIKKATAANNRANAAYLKYSPEAYTPEALPMVGGTAIGPEPMPSVGNLAPYTPNAKSANPSILETTMRNAAGMETPAVPTTPRTGGGLYNRMYNTLSSFGDSSIGADKSLKATFKQSVNNETAYRKALTSYNETIDALMLARDRYPSTSDEYKKYSTAIEGIYAAADSLRDKAADMTDANEFMASAEQLRKEATKGLSGLPLQLAEAAISVGDNLTTMGMTGFNPTATLIMMGAKAAGQRANELSNQGVSAGDAFSRGVLSGVIEGVTEKIGLDNLLDIVSSNNVKVLSSILKQMASEGGEEGLSSIMNYAADRMSGDNKAFDWDDFSQSVIQGALSGFIFGAGGTVTNKVLPMVSGYSDMEHLNMAREMEGKTLKSFAQESGGYSANTANANVNIGNMSAEEYLNAYNSQGNAMPSVWDAAPSVDSKPMVGGAETANGNTQNIYGSTNIGGTETVVFDSSDPTNILTDTDVKAYNFIEKTAEQKGLTAQKIYSEYKTGRDRLFNKTINDIFEVYKQYRPQGTQLINTTENMGGGTVEKAQRISNNEVWYSEAFKEYGHKPNQNQLRQFIEKKVNSDVRNGGGEYVDADTARKLQAFDSLLNGYEKITENGARNVQDIRLNENGYYEVDYNTADKEAAKGNTVVEQLRNNISNLSGMNAVKNLTGEEFSKTDKGLVEQVMDFIKEYVTKNGAIIRAGFGEINVTKRGVKSSLAHGIGREKAVAFAAIPEVLKNGKEIGFQENWKNRNYDTYLFAAPVTINNEKCYVGAVVKKNVNTNTYYLHEIVDSNGNIIEINKGDGAQNSDVSTGLKTRSIDAREGNTSPNNIVPNSEQKSNSVGNNNLGIINPDVQKTFEAVNQIKEGSKSLYQGTISGWAPFEGMAKVDTRENGRNIAALTNKYAQKGGIVDTVLTRGLYDINGNKVSDLSFVDVASQVPKDQLTVFNDYWHEKHNIDRQAQGKPVTAHTADESRQIVAEYEKQHPEFVTYQQNISNYLDTFMQTWLVDSGLMSQADYLNMKKMYPYYVPTFRVDDGVSGGGSVKSGKKIRGSNAVGKAKGSTADVLSFDEAITQKINSVITAATKNDISREIFSFAQVLPGEAAKSGILIDTDTSSQYAGQIDLGEFMDNVDKNIARQISKGNYEITFYNDGKPQTMKISRDVWEAYNFLDSKLGDTKGYKTFASIGRALTNPMRAMTTTYNPLFFMTNLMRDAQTYTINNTAKNSIVATKNYVKALVEIAKRSDTYNQYKALGGSQNGYYGSNMYQKAETNVNPGAKTFGQKALGVLKSPLTAIESMGEFTEKIPRYAEYLNTIDRLGNTDAGRLQASLNAADVTVNFNRSSTLSTLANAWVPYFNAGLQGMDKTFRQIKAHPVQTTARATVSVFLPTLLLYIVNKDNPHWEDVKDGVRDNYYLIPNMSGPKDGNGYAETFIRLPKSREFGAIFSASFERFIRAINESEENGDSLNNTLPSAFDGYLETLLNSVAPPDILGDNIVGSFARLGTNTAWHGGKIVPSNLEKVSPRNQYDINTSGIAMGIANAAQSLPVAPGWLESPMKVDYLIDSYGGYAGDLLQGLTSRKNIGSNDQETLLNSLDTGFVQPFKNRLTTDSAYSNYNLDRFYDKTDKLETAANDRDIDENLPTEYRTPEEKVESDFAKAQKQISDLTKQERSILESEMPIKEKNALIRDIKKLKNDIAKSMLSQENQLYAMYAENYIPEISMLTDERQQAAKELNQKYGLAYDDFADIYEKYAEINKDKDLSAKMKTTKFDEYLTSLGYTDEYAITDDLTNEFAYYSASPATSYYDSKNYKIVENFVPVEMYADLSGRLNKLKSGIDYPKGQRSPYYKKAIDMYLEAYGYDVTRNQRIKIYESLGVAKSYWY
mgnify:CR=1 FL=1